jgi:hypothetical protein
VYNNHDSWSCYCHSCHEGAFIPKELVKPLPETVEAIAKGMPITEEITSKTVDIELIADYAHKSGVSIVDLMQWGFKYEPKLRRLLYISPVGSPYVVMGRALTRSNMKWYRYGGLGGYVSLGNINAANVYLTEDILSAHKLYDTLRRMVVRDKVYFDNFAVVCCLGTTMCTPLLIALLEAKSVVIALDGDTAGRNATLDFKRTLALYNIPHTVLEVPDGLDPKHLNYDALYERILNVSKHYVSQGL